MFSPKWIAKIVIQPNLAPRIQPNLAPRRAVLLAQAQKAQKDFELESCWVDIKNNSIMILPKANARPVPIRSSEDIARLCPRFVPDQFIFCAGPPKFQVFPTQEVTSDN